MSITVAAGQWNAPTRFFPSGRSMPTFPPIAASTWPTRVDGTAIQSIPRRYVAATKPARSVVEPPPTRDEGGRALEVERAPEPLRLSDGLRGFAAGHEVRCLDAVERGDALVRDEGVARGVAVGSEPDPCRGEHDAVGIDGPRVGDVLVERLSSLVALPELALVPCERPPAPADALPRRVHVDVEVDDERVELVQEPPRLDGAASHGDHGRVAPPARVAHEPRLELAKRRLPLLREELPDRAVRVLDLAVHVVERAAQPPRDLLADGRLPRAHEAHEHEVSA